MKIQNLAILNKNKKKTFVNEWHFKWSFKHIRWSYTGNTFFLLTATVSILTLICSNFPSKDFMRWISFLRCSMVCWSFFDLFIWSIDSCCKMWKHQMQILKYQVSFKSANTYLFSKMQHGFQLRDFGMLWILNDFAFVIENFFLHLGNFALFL